MFRVDLIVRPRDGVRDPQGDAVEESLSGLGYNGIKVHAVGRYLRLSLEAESAAAARALADDMCRRLLVNPNLETYDITVEPGTTNPKL
jgi:phosphoribosylformylglycinamidine synthase PurS subunit